MDLIRFGILVRALRRRRGWRQVDLARAARVSQGTVSLVERGHSDRLAHATLMRMAAALDARVSIELRWRGGELDRLVDRDHAILVGAISRKLQRSGWEVQIEVTYAIYGQNGSIDVLAWHPATSALLVLEIKTEMTSAEATVRKLDEKVRLARKIAFERFGWAADSVSRLLVVEESTTNRRRVATAAALFNVAVPARAVAVRTWLGAPSGTLSGMLFLPFTNGRRGMSPAGGRHRVRRAAADKASDPRSAVTASREADDEAARPVILTNRT